MAEVHNLHPGIDAEDDSLHDADKGVAVGKVCGQGDNWDIAPWGSV